MTVRRFVGLWLGLTGIIVAYAVVDLATNPWLMQESGLTLKPDLGQLSSVVHWGGRLLRWSGPALLANALLLGGLLALGLHALWAGLMRRAGRGTDRVSVYPVAPRQSVPPL